MLEIDILENKREITINGVTSIDLISPAVNSDVDINYSRLIVTKSYNNSRIIYIYFINIHNSVLEYPFENDFLNNRKSSYLNECKEKSEIKWIKYTDLESFNLIHGLKKIILRLN